MGHDGRSEHGTTGDTPMSKRTGPRRPPGPFAGTAWLIGAAVALSACQAAPAVPGAHGPRADTMGRMQDLADRYAADKRNGMAGVIADVEGCYAAASRYPTDPYALRDCLILDAVAAREDDRNGGAFGWGNLPYFDTRVRADRWGRYGRLARFTDSGRQLRYMADGAGLVEGQLQGRGGGI